MGLIRLMKRVVGGGYAAVQPADGIACDVTQTTITPNGSAAAAPLASLVGQLDAYRYKKAINAAYPSIVPSAVDAMIAFATQTTASGNPPGSNTMQAATTNILAPPGGDFESLVLSPWLQGSTAASPPGLGLSSSSSPTLAATVASLRAAAFSLTN